jgi:hypothetical protein
MWRQWDFDIVIPFKVAELVIAVDVAGVLHFTPAVVTE